MNDSLPVLHTIEDLDAAWLERALGTPVAGFTTERIGTGQMSLSYRVALDGGASVVVKLAASDETSRQTGVGLGAYEREVRFYRELAPRLGDEVAACHAAVLDADEGWFTLVLEDAAPATQGDQIAGCSVDEARLALGALARIHAPLFADPQLGATPWLNQEMPLNQALVTQLAAGFFERYGARVTPEHREVVERFVASMDGWIADRRPPLGLVHGDFRLDNMLFGAGDGGRPFMVVDWQTVGWGPVMTDASYFLGSGLTVQERREHEESLIREYHDELTRNGVEAFGWDECWTGYRRQCFLGILMVVAPAMIVERTPRGDEMFMVSLARFAQQAIDLEALELLPEAGSGRPAPLRPEPADEGRHPAGVEPLWNESWYFDAVSDDGATGVYARLGLYPNLGVTWVTAFVCGPGRPTAAVIDFAAPLPAGDALDAAGLALACDAALERYTVRLDAEGELHDDPAALLRGEAGRPAPVAFDLTWQTHGEPYAYRVATRYEIPCTVTGRVRVGDEELELRGVGQRDHSWGARDWWSAEWMWCAGHLDDGTRFHGVEFRLPDTPPLGLGYLQPPEGGLVEVDSVRASEEVAGNGLIATAQLHFGADDLSLEAVPQAFGPLRLEAPDGRVSQFPRAMCRVTAADGRTGVAWVEWNRNRSL